MSESRELAAHDGGQGREVAPSTSIPIEQRMMMLREALTNPDVDPAKAVAMADLMFKLEDRDRQAEFNRALIAAKAEIGPIFKRGYNSHQKTKYAKFEDIQRVTDPVLERHGLDLSYKIGSEGPNITVVPVIRHLNGWEWEGLPIKGPPDKGPGRSDIQSVGSSASYLQRYAAKGALNLRFDGEDDDGVPVRPDEALNDRQSGLVVDAQAAADRGEYQAWFGRQNTKDKAVLINSGHHARLGGAPALPGAQTIDANAQRRDDPPREERRDPPADQRQKPEGPDITTPGGWTEQYEIDCRNAPDLEALLRIQSKGAKAMGRLKENDTTLWQRAIDAGSAAHKRLTGDGDDDGSGAAAPAGGLFGDDK